MPVPPSTPPQTFEGAARSNLIDFVETTVRQTLAQSRDYTSDFPAFIADPNPEPGPFGVAKAIAQQSCRRWARGEGIPSLPGFDAGYGAICEPYLDGLGESPTPGGLSVPFTGGQCPGVIYRITYTSQSINTNGTLNPPQTSSRNAVGPIFGIRGEGSPQFQSIVAVTGQGLQQLESGNCAQGCFTNIQFVSVAPRFSDPDICGDPPPEYRPPISAPGLPPLAPITVDLPGIGPVDVDVSFNPDGSINVSLPDLGVDVEVPNPFGPPEGSPGIEPSSPGDQGQPGDAIDVGDGDAADETDPDRNLTGVLVQTISYPPRVNRLFNPTESYTKGAYYVYIGGDAGLTLIDTAAITRQDQFYPAPPGSNRFRVVPNAGFTLRVTPHYEEG